MARASFGGGSADFVYRIAGPGGLIALTSATLTAWTAETGGTQLADLLLGGLPAAVIPVGDDGQIPTFQGPDGVTGLWVDGGGPSRSYLRADTPSGGGGAPTFDNAAALNDYANGTNTIPATASAYSDATASSDYQAGRS